MRTSPIHRRVAVSLSALLLAACPLVPSATTAARTGSLDSPGHWDFYTPPADVPAAAPANGDLIRTEPFPLALSSPGLPGPVPATAQRIMYRSTGAAGGPVAVTGAVLSSTRPWTGSGPRPLAVVAAETHGQGDSCAPSKNVQNLATIRTTPPSVSIASTLITAGFLTDAGVDVVITDYEGLGTPGVHPYFHRESQARAVLDAARAAIRLPGSGRGGDTPVVFSGYSQGGAAVAAAVELATGYAPELRAIAATIGAPPADPGAVLPYLDGTLVTPVLGYVLNGFTAVHPELRPLVENRLNDRGRSMLDTVAEQCLLESEAEFGLRDSGAFTRDGRPLSSLFRDIPELADYTEEQRVGRLGPTVPVRIHAAVHDDAVPLPQIERLARDWCGAGTAVDLRLDPLPALLPGSTLNHLLPFLTTQREAVSYLTDRVNGVPTPDTCAGPAGVPRAPS